MDEGTQSSGEILLAIDWQVSSFLSTCKLSIGRHLLCNTTQPYTNGSKINRCHIHMIAEVHAAPTTACTTTCFVPMVNPSRWGSARACMSSASFQRASLVVTKPDLVALSPHAALPSTFHAPLSFPASLRSAPRSCAGSWLVALQDPIVYLLLREGNHRFWCVETKR